VRAHHLLHLVSSVLALELAACKSEAPRDRSFWCAVPSEGGCPTEPERDGPDILGLGAKAPIIQDGDVAGQPSELVVNLDLSMDLRVAGRGLAKARATRITLPGAIVPDGRPPAQYPFSVAVRPEPLRS